MIRNDGYRYIIIKRSLCKECGGGGRIQHPMWELWEKVPTDKEVTIDDWFKEQGFSERPSSTLQCPECGGKGYVEKEVYLREALEDIGLK